MANTKLPARLLDTSAIPALNVTGDFTVDTTTLKVDSTNNRVGIGVASPSELLEVRKDSGNAIIKVQTGGGHDARLILDSPGASGAQSQIFFDDSGTTAGSIQYTHNSGGTDFMTFHTGGSNTERIRIDSAGNVGIGTTPSTTKLDIKTANIASGSDFGTKAIITRMPLVSGYNGAIVSGLGFYDNTIHSADIGYTYNRNSTGGYDLAFSTNDDTNGNPVERMTINADGKVGIGTNNPNSRLHVKSSGTGNVLYVESSDGHHLGGFYQESDTRAAFNVRDASGSVKVNLDAGGDSWFTGGDIGIGTNNPSSRLHVQDTADSQILIYETGASPYTATLKLASQSTTAYGANVQYTSQAEQLTIENFGRALGATATSGGIRFRTKVGNSSMQEVMNINGNTGAVTKPYQPVAIYTHTANSEDGAYYKTFAGTGARTVIARPQTAVVNRGSMYNASNGRFTAPLAGVYRYAVHGNLYTSALHANAYWTWRIYKNTAHYIYHYESNGTRAANGWVYINCGGIIEMAANDYLRFELKTNNLSSTQGFGMDLDSYTHYEFQLLY